MLVNAAPILIAVLAGVWLGEGFPRWLVAGLAVAFAGVLLIGLAGRGSGGGLAGGLLFVVAAGGCTRCAGGPQPGLRPTPPLLGHPLIRRLRRGWRVPRRSLAG